jgi:hypothetical protein
MVDEEKMVKTPIALEAPEIIIYQTVDAADG